MKKFLAILLGGAMLATTIAGLAGCKPDGPGPDGPGPVGPGPDVPQITRRADPRAADAYEAYDYEGEPIGSFKTIADAINATVEADLDFTEDETVLDGAEGGYVVKKGSTTKLFRNRKGYGDGNSDQFWYYEDGNKLAGYNCWDATNSMEFIKNKKTIVHEIDNMGLNPVQSWNGYALLNEHGAEDNEMAAPMSWAFSSPMDAGVFVFPSSKGGVNGTGMSRNTYSLDFSEVKITPAYEGVTDPIYAFVGFYIWNPEYVVAIGIGCDTTTGLWYRFNASSRNDSFSDAEYDIGECVLESTWHEEGYFTPNATEAEMKIETVKSVDEEFDEEYFTCEFEIAFKDGETVKTTVDDTLLAQYTTQSVSIWNDYMFLAGLDIKNKVTSGVRVGNTDYFNGAKFEGLCVTGAEVYFPTEEELSDVDYMQVLDPTRRGRSFDFLLSNDEESDGVYGYTVLNNYVCASFESKDGADYYNFRFDGDPVGETLYGGDLKVYQDQIDSLSEMTAENVNDYLDLYTEIGSWYGKDDAHTESKLTAFHLNLLDFAPYKAAQEVYKEALNLSEDAKEVLAALDGLSLLASYEYKGWTVPDAETPVKGYLWSEAQEFAEIRAKYKGLQQDEQKKVLTLSVAGQDGYDNWELAYDGIAEYLSNEAYTSQSYRIGSVSMGDAGMVTYDGTQALTKLFELAIKIKSTAYTGQAITGGIDSDAHDKFGEAFHLLFLMKKMEEADVELPEIYMEYFDAITAAERSQYFVDDFNDYLYPVLSLAGDIYRREQAGEFVWLNAEMAETINAYMVGFEFQEAGFSYNIPNGDIRDRESNYEKYFGLPNTDKSLSANVKYIMDIIRRDDPEAETKINANGYALDAEVTPLATDPSENISDEAKEVKHAFEEFSSMPKYEYKGWKAPEDAESVKGYLYSEWLLFKANVYTKWQALTDPQKAEVRSAITSGASLDAWLALAEEDDILESYEAFADFTVTTYANPKVSATKEFAGMELFDQYVRWIYKIYTKADFGEYNDYGTGDGTMNMDTSPFPSAYLCLLRDLMPEGFEMPGFLQDAWDAIQKVGYGDFYEGAYYPIYNTAKLAVRIHDEGLTTISQLTEEELAFLNKVWVDSYVLGGHIQWNWVSGAKFETYMSERSLQIVKYAGGNLTKDDASQTPYKTYEYIEIVGKFLEGCGYSLDVSKNGWGVTDGTIAPPEEEAPIQTAQEVITEFNKLSDVTNMAAYDYKGWTTMGDDLKGYFSSELTHFGKILAAYNALGAEQSTVDAAVNTANWNAWVSLNNTLTAWFTAVEGKQIEAATLGFGDSYTYTASQALAELLNALDKVNGNLDSDNNWEYSFRVYYLLAELNALDADLPEFVEVMIATKEKTEDDAGRLSSDLKADIRYLSIVLKLAKKLQANPAYTLTAEEIAEINATMVGKTRFQENGLNWNFNPETGEMGDRGSSFVIYFGLSKEHTFGYYLDLVTNYLIQTYQATGAGYTGRFTSTQSAYNMGITEEISAPAAD